jgi:hypothetical protein
MPRYFSPTQQTKGKAMRKHITPAPEGTDPTNELPPSPYRVGDEIIFKFEGNLRARVEGYEIIAGRPWLVVGALLKFTVPLSKVVGAEPEE